jgi:hypothetical protein
MFVQSDVFRHHDAIRELLDARLAAKVVKLSSWLFSTATGRPYNLRNVPRDMKRAHAGHLRAVATSPLGHGLEHRRRAKW